MNELRSFLTPQKRSCGECQACCYAIGVIELGKPFSMRCEHQCNKGCAIYSRRPDSCEGYQCLWLSGIGSMGDRPDKSGFLLHLELTEGVWLEIYHTRPDNTFDNDSLENAVNDVLRRYGGLSGVRFILYDQIRNAEYKLNLKTYPNGANWSLPNTNTSWAYLDTTTQTYLYAPLRSDPNKKPRIALPIVNNDQVRFTDDERNQTEATPSVPTGQGGK